MLLYRFCKTEFLKDISGNGAKLFGGRWNSKGLPLLYTSESVSLALLEFLSNVSNNIYLGKTGFVILDVPKNIAINEIKQNDLPKNWKQYPATESLRKIGDEWIKENKYLLSKVPSSIVDIESNYLINPIHKDFNKIKVLAIKPYDIDKRLYN